jgi:CheY-like chemotaxis protein
MTTKSVAPPEESDLASPQSKRSSLRRILVVDDEPDVRFINTNVLIHHGYHVEVAEDGAAAWEALAQNNYDLLITDNQMPKVSGLELIERLRAARMSLPVIMATGTLPKDEFTRAVWGKSTTLLLKPYTSAELLGTVAAALRLTPDLAVPTVPPPAAPLR